ncbi:CHAT domain-containing protein [Acidobacteriia bacterium AH_259_A11_L15]|nr:CHAT domain-containing protein [Acidobacteriia bacterium AH_259_A11_L15]
MLSCSWFETKRNIWAQVFLHKTIFGIPMLILRLTQASEVHNQHRVEVVLEGVGPPGHAATARFHFRLTAQEQEDLRWYLEDYLQNPLDPMPKIAARIENRMAEIGTELFKAVFQANNDVRDLWAMLRGSLKDTRVEIFTDVRGAATIPWELIRDPTTDMPLVLQARAFVRAHHQTAQRLHLPPTRSGPIRILLVVCRPGGREDVPFRSVASRLIKGLSATARDAFQLDVLRPPTFEQLGRALRAAKAKGEPYRVVHFDGHGLYAEVAKPDKLEEIVKRFSPLLPSTLRKGAHGYLAFENPKLPDNVELVGGHKLGKLLVEMGVPVLVLNACRSAHADAPEAPLKEEEDDPHGQVRAYGSLAHEVMDTGVAGVVAMRYNVYVVTAAQFVLDLYAALTQGQTLGEAVTLGRKQLHDQPLREIAYAPRSLQDWLVPVVYESAPVALFPKSPKGEKFTITLHPADTAPARGKLDANLPKPPDVGFFGRDETLLAVDRAFDTHSIVLLHAFAGSGKTATAAEFARWYTLTGGVDGPVLFTSFELYKPLARVVDAIEQVFRRMLEQTGIHWLALSEDQRRDVALRVLQQVPVLWIWDNVETVAGFPAGVSSAWCVAEQQELAEFLRAARKTRAKFLLTSRRDERAWLGNLPARIIVPPMPMQERVQLAKALAEKHRRLLTDLEDWRPLLQFTRGNPLTMTVVVDQALRDGLRTREQIEGFVSKLRAGEAAFEDEAGEGRSKSLGASLSYGFKHAFSEAERKQLALLHLFQGFVHAGALRAMGVPEKGWCLPEVCGLTREAARALLDRAAEIGLLTAIGDYYSIHPALPWFLRRLFEQHYADRREQAERAYVEMVGWFGDYCFAQNEGGDPKIINVLTIEEENFLYARRLARTHGWWNALTSTMQGLRGLYSQAGRRVEWARLVNEIVPDFVEPATDGALPGREEDWGLVTEWRMDLARQMRQWKEAERLQNLRVAWERQSAASALAVPPEALDAHQRSCIRTLAVSLAQLGYIQREQGKAECVAPHEEAVALHQRIGDRIAEAFAALNLGHVYGLPALRDLAKAEYWYRRSLELWEERHQGGRATSLRHLGLVAHERFKEAQATKKPEEELRRHLNAAVQFYWRALELIPPNAAPDLARVHSGLAHVYYDMGNPGRALTHCSEAIRHFESEGDFYEAAKERRNFAVALTNAGMYADALEFANAALRNYQAYGPLAEKEMQQTKKLVKWIKRLQ